MSKQQFFLSFVRLTEVEISGAVINLTLPAMLSTLPTSDKCSAAPVFFVFIRDCAVRFIPCKVPMGSTSGGGDVTVVYF